MAYLSFSGALYLNLYNRLVIIDKNRGGSAMSPDPYGKRNSEISIKGRIAYRKRP